jgi:hypothetical protein
MKTHLVSIEPADGTYVALKRLFDGVLQLPSVNPRTAAENLQSLHQTRLIQAISSKFKTNLACLASVPITVYSNRS